MGKKNKRRAANAPLSRTGLQEKSVESGVMDLVNMVLEKCTKPASNPACEWEEYTEIYQLVERLREKQADMQTAAPDRNECITEFIDWLVKNGVNTEAVTIFSAQDQGFGLKANKLIQAGDLFLMVPRKMMMSIDSAKQSVLGPLMSCDKMLQLMPNVALALHLLCERQSNSFWLPYIKFLPSTYSTCLYFTPDEIKELKGSPVFSEAISLYKNIARQYCYFYKLFQSHHDATKLPIRHNFCYHDYRWAVSAVMTRQNQVPTIGGGELVNTFIPLWDMCNHANGQMTTDFDLDKDCIACYAQRDFAPGQQVDMFYGRRSNADFFLHSGFVYAENENDCLKIKLGISKNDSLYVQKTEVLNKLGLPSSGTFLLHCGQLPVDSDLLVFLRVFQMSQDNLIGCLSACNTDQLKAQLADIDSIINKDNEIKAWSFLEIRATLLLKAYVSSYEDDLKLLDSTDISHHKKLAVQLRMCEKRILLATQHYAASRKQAVVAKHDPDKNDM